MELDLQLTPRSRILLGILGAVLLLWVAIQIVPAFYRLFANQEAKAKQEQLLKTENLVRAAEVLKPIETEIYKATGLANTEDQKAVSLFDTQPPETVIRARFDGGQTRRYRTELSTANETRCRQAESKVDDAKPRTSRSLSLSQTY